MLIEWASLIVRGQGSGRQTVGPGHHIHVCRCYRLNNSCLILNWFLNVKEGVFMFHISWSKCGNSHYFSDPNLYTMKIDLKIVWGKTATTSILLLSLHLHNVYMLE